MILFGLLCFVFLLFSSSPGTQAASFRDAHPKVIIQDASLNYREFNVTLWGVDLTMAAMSHPVLTWKDIDGVSVLKEKGITHLISLEVKGTSTLVDEWTSKGGVSKLIDVVDYGAPSFQQLADFLSFLKFELSRQINIKVGFHCLGGNGRTGTFLTVLQIVSMLQQNCTDLSDEQLYNVDGKTVPKIVAVAVNKIREKDFDGVSIETHGQLDAVIDLLSRRDSMID
jgi:protein tyrosine phosphatase